MKEFLKDKNNQTGKKYIPIIIKGSRSKIYLDNLTKIYKITKIGHPTIPPFHKNTVSFKLLKPNDPEVI